MGRAQRTSNAACTRCVRRSWLLGELSAVLDRNCRNDGRLFELLALDDEQLIDALGGRRRAELRRSYADFDASALPLADGIAAICRHDRRYPTSLRGQGAPQMLYATGDLERLHALTGAPLVAILACRRASDYGLELARALGRGLGASGLTIAVGDSGGIAQAALAGALEADGATLVVAGDGLGIGTAACRRATRVHHERRGSTLAELQHGVRGRRWGTAAGERIIASLADVAVVVEAEEHRRALAAARMARSQGSPLAVFPGRVSSPASSGSHLLLREGARLVRDAADVLDLLYGADEGSTRHTATTSLPELAPRLRAVCDQVAMGIDTPGELTAGAGQPGAVLAALGELELLGVVRRGDGGRYVICDGRH
jgi:DNA processing protein